MRILLTGHTGFKGAWLTVILTEAGHEVIGYSLNPEPQALFEVAGLDVRLSGDYRADIRDAAAVSNAVNESRPDLVLHLAAQPLVRDSYSGPRHTVETNVMGTLAILEAIKASSSVSAAVLITTDKVYRNVNQRHGYVESDALGGHDPYSSSKAMADLLIQSWVSSFPGPPTAIARAGNVIGGGDVCKDRLMPDLIRGFSAGKPVEIRYPSAVRPWQHVMDCLQGYVDLSYALLDGLTAGGEWNFGPGEDSFRTVAEVANLTQELWSGDASWVDISGDHPHEATLLALDASKARSQLGWKDRLNWQDAVSWTVEWHKAVEAGTSPVDATLAQFREYRHRDAH
jgi:CDP-glucose 4,6-dehydratase